MVRFRPMTCIRPVQQGMASQQRADRLAVDHLLASGGLQLGDVGGGLGRCFVGDLDDPGSFGLAQSVRDPRRAWPSDFLR
jgi:hypothetical protein